MIFKTQNYINPKIPATLTPNPTTLNIHPKPKNISPKDPYDTLRNVIKLKHYSFINPI